MDPETKSASTRGRVSVPSSCVGISFGYRLAIATNTQNAKKGHNFSLLTLKANPSPSLFVLSSTFSYMLYLLCNRKTCEIPSTGDDRNY